MPDKLKFYKSNLQTEYKFALVICFITPLFAIIFLPFIRGYAGYLISLRLPDHTNYLENLFNYTTVLVVIILSIFPLIWLVSIKLELRYGKGLCKRKPFALGISVLFILLASIAFKMERVQWFYLEAGKVRFEKFSFLRTLAYWKKDEMDFVKEEKKHQLIAFGSSQVNLGIDRKLLEARSPELQVRVKALPAFSILQYNMHTDYILEQKPDGVVCWISEYDIFREHQIPANRLRYFATFDQALQLGKLIGVRGLWYNRGQIADISFASFMTFWRDRDMLKELVLHSLRLPSDIPISLQDDKEKDQEVFWRYVNELQDSMQRTGFAEVNFDSFEIFAQTVVENGIKLYVFEGVTHPVAMSVYDPGSTFRRETRKRLRTMADRIGFCYVDESQLPEFNASDFADVFHLNDKARNRFTCFLADYFSDRYKTDEKLRSVRK